MAAWRFTQTSTPRLSCHRFPSNEVCLWLNAIAYHLRRRLALANRIENWSLANRRQWLVKTGGCRVRRAHYYWLRLAESHLIRRFFGALVGRIASLPSPAG
jgi:hypothetical protein